MKAAIASMLAIAFTLGAAYADNRDSAVVYKWVDDNGVPQYTDRPPRGTEAERTAVVSRRTDPAAVQAREQAQSDLNAARATRRELDEEAGAETAERQARTQEQRQANCEQARSRAQTYATSRRLYRPLPNGEREYLSDDELDKARADAQAAVREWCD